ncbi:unnamed protein product [Nezara viridula]|uniref:Uncharacterized protein n=1 Tax=Nezara viridula TaxID=85310 RepID=A0A9P0HSP4_NEZVI|nr:unnamed protein product [Nezara viridula]
MFPYKNIDKGTTDGLTVNQIDHILVNNRYVSSFTDVRVFRGANVDPLRVRAKSKKFKIDKFKDPQIMEAYAASLYSQLRCMEDSEDSVSGIWSNCRKTIEQTAEAILGDMKRKTGKADLMKTVE